MDFEKNVRMATMDDVNESVIPKATSQQVESIKSQISMETANVKIMPYKVYSPNEQAIGEWQEEVDGVLKQKPVYEKTVTGTATGTNSQWISIDTISTILPNLDEIVSTSKVAHGTSSSTDKFHIPEIDINANNQLEVCQKYTGNSMTYNYIIILQYTKTTDQWETVE